MPRFFWMNILFYSLLSLLVFELGNASVVHAFGLKKKPLPPIVETVSLPLATEEVPEKKDKQLDITSDTLVYDDALAAYILTGHVHMMVEDQNIVMDADKVTYQPDLDILVAEGNIKLLKEGTTTDAAYMRIRLDSQTALVNDPLVSLNFVRLRAKTALAHGDITHLKDGALIVVPRDALEQTKPRKGTRYVGGNKANGTVTQVGYIPYVFNSKRTQRFVDADNLRANPMKEAQDFISGLKRQGFDPTEVILNTEEEKPKSELFRLNVKQVKVIQHPNDYYMIDFKAPRLRYKETSLLPLPNFDLGVDKKNGRVDYLGPELGFNRDLGGLYYNPGFDFKLGQGALKLSPFGSYGQTINRGSNTIDLRDPEFGYGIMGSYRSKRLRLMVGRNFKNDYNVLEGEYFLFDKNRNTKLIASQNAFAGNSFFTQERPSYSVQVQDSRRFFRNKLFSLTAVHSGGIFKDDFFPFNSANPFVTPPSANPATAGRLRQQLVLNNTRPLFKLGNNVEFGLTGQASNAYYSTGDFVSILRGGPTANVFLGDFFMSQITYTFGATSGQSPFVFDSFFLGNQTVTLNNVVRLGPYAMLGLRQDFNLSNNNARNDALVGNNVYISVGSRNLKVLIGYDTVFRRTNFGVSYYPNTTQSEIAFEDAYLYSAISPLNPEQMEAFRQWNKGQNQARRQTPAVFSIPQKKNTKKNASTSTK
jgi:hypothetical protein